MIRDNNTKVRTDFITNFFVNKLEKVSEYSCNHIG